VTKSEALSWLGVLNTREIGDVLSDPRADFGEHMAQRLSGQADICEVRHRTSLDTREQRWQFRPTEVEEVEELRQRLDDWWDERSDGAKDALIAARRTQTIQGLYLDDLAAFGAEGLVDTTRRDLRGQFQVPKLFRAYLKVIAREGGETS
jgi:hypothetical protein